MSIKRFSRSVLLIISNPNVNTIAGITAHVCWQIRKLFNLFPFRLKLSNSFIIAEDGQCSVSALINNQGLYDYNNMSLLKRLMQNDIVFFDIGANIGAFSIVASEYSGSVIHSFEPHPNTFLRLNKNITENNRKNIFSHNFAVSNVDEFVLLSDTPGSSTTHIVPEQSINNTLQVQSVRIDSFCNKENIIPNIVKIDVEGYELSVLEGFGSFLRKIDVIFVEINGLSDARGFGEEKIVSLLADNGFAGPFTYDEHNKWFRKLSKSNFEDPVFLSENFIEKLNGDFKIDIGEGVKCE